YYLRELGYALWPWTAIAVVAVPAALARAQKAAQPFLPWLALWALLAYAVVSISMTKFHHYILPAVPAIAALTGWFLDRLAAGSFGPGTPAALLLVGLPALGMVSWDLVQTPQAAQRLLWLFDFDYINNRRGR